MTTRCCRLANIKLIRWAALNQGFAPSTRVRPYSRAPVVSIWRGSQVSRFAKFMRGGRVLRSPPMAMPRVTRVSHMGEVGWRFPEIDIFDVLGVSWVAARVWMRIERVDKIHFCGATCGMHGFSTTNWFFDFSILDSLQQWYAIAMRWLSCLRAGFPLRRALQIRSWHRRALRAFRVETRLAVRRVLQVNLHESTPCKIAWAWGSEIYKI